MNFWWILYIFDGLLFFFVFLTILYMVFFSLASLFNKPHDILVQKTRIGLLF